MLKRVKFILIFLVIFGCIEPYEFRITDKQPSLVVEGYISDKSFNETLAYPSDGRFFYVKLSYTGDVINTRPLMISGAAVWLIDDQDEEWAYTESETPGLYQLLNNDFKALPGIRYKIHVLLPDESEYESSWESLPAEAPAMGEISFYLKDEKRYVVESGEPVLRTIKGISANIDLPENNTGSPVFYRWKYTPTWIYIAPLTPSSKCWAVDPNAIKDYTLQQDFSGGYRKDLFWLATIRNEKIFEKLSVLVTQFSMSEDQYFFWKNMQDLAQAGIISDSPPYNLKTNLSPWSEDKKVSGYFGVAGEQATRWYFKAKDLPYHVENTLRADCLVVFGPDPPAPECFDCREYSRGIATATKPVWWEN